MDDHLEQAKAALIDAAAQLANRRQKATLPGRIESMMRAYYSLVAPQDFEGKKPIDLYAPMIRHWQLANHRAPNESLVRVYNPSVDEDGWSSSHTIIDVVADNSPFIVDSLLALLARRNIHLHLAAHPIAQVTRDDAGALVKVTDVGPSDDGNLESLVHLEIDRIEQEALEEFHQAVVSVLADVRVTVDDWEAMGNKALEIADELDSWRQEAQATGHPRYECDTGTSPKDVAELLRWMQDDNFTFIGYCDYRLVDEDDNNGAMIRSRPETGLGILRGRAMTERDLKQLPTQAANLVRRPLVMNLTKANRISTVHRPAPLDYIGIKDIDATGKVRGERRFLGLFGSTAYTTPVGSVPVVKTKVDEVIQRSPRATGSHARNQLLDVLQRCPRDELFQIGADDLYTLVHDIGDLRDRRRVSLFTRPDVFGRFLSCLVFVPRERYNTDVRLEIVEILTQLYQGTSHRFSTEISDSPMARVHLIIHTNPQVQQAVPDRVVVEARLNLVIRTWDDFLRSSLVDTHGEARGLSLFNRYHEAFDKSYRNDILAESAVNDIDRLEALGPLGLDVALHHPLEAASGDFRCTLYRKHTPITLSEFIPVLHDLGATVVDERPYEIAVDGEPRRFVYNIGLRFESELDPEARSRFRDAVIAVARGEVESDSFARLVLTACLDWRQVAVLRSYARYLLQVGISFSPTYVRETINANPSVARLLLDLFAARLSPTDANEDAAKAILAQVRSQIDNVAGLDTDRILSSFVDVIQATVRTNYWQRGQNGFSAALALKLEPTLVPGIPKPVPNAEIFVHSPRVEGVHLRAGKVARGGIRWSDRMEDFRTEILGLMKAQTIKNSVIVPVGAKGGFISKQLAGDSRETTMKEVVWCYQSFIQALLDVTDNRQQDGLVSPTNVLCLDDHDPYLVVAADKGTSTFSDIANKIAEQRGFWLGDAFASGGSAGYDHKALGITARGGWVSVAHHFSQLGLDVSQSEFSVVGIGDMSGDVFGNAMLLSDKIHLVAAFDHRHIFVDPNPDPTVSIDERRRLFQTPRSSWADYDPDLISPGGGVFSRSAKTIPVSAEMASALDIDAGVTALTPSELIVAVLKAPVDLFWNGGIGTYIKASSETNEAIGDRTNDSVRINANQLRCRVVGEGGNLGVTQLGRIEFAKMGGLINSDAIDNSAGVDTSDHEVNLKVLLSVAEAEGDLTRKQRDHLLQSLADQVCDQVLSNNTAQNLALTAAASDSPGMIDVYQRLIGWLEQDAGLDRQLESLPSNEQLLARQECGEGLHRPELAVLMAYTKNHATELLLRSNLAEDDDLDDRLLSYFPPAVRNQFADLVPRHPLKRDLLCTLVSNDLINRGGISMVHRLMGETAATVDEIARAHRASWTIYDLEHLLDQVTSLGADVDPKARVSAYHQVMRLGERGARWLLRNAAQPLDISDSVLTYRQPVADLFEIVATNEAANEHMVDHELDRDSLIDGRIPPELADRLVLLDTAFGFLDLSAVAAVTGVPLTLVAGTHTRLDHHLNLSWLRLHIMELPRSDHWMTLARSALRDEYFREHAHLTSVVVGTSPAGDNRLDSDAAAQRWIQQNQVSVNRFRNTFADIGALGEHDLAQMSVAVRALTQLSRAS